MKYQLSSEDDLKQASRKAAEIYELLSLCAQHHTNAKVNASMALDTKNSKASKKNSQDHIPQLAATISTSDSFRIKNPIEKLGNVTGNSQLEEAAKTLHRVEDLYRQNAEILGLATITLRDPTMEIKYIGGVASSSTVMVKTDKSDIVLESLSRGRTTDSIGKNLPSMSMLDSSSNFLQQSLSAKSMQTATTSSVKSKKKLVKYL